MAKYSAEEYLKFISEYAPNFDRREDKIQMFTIPTQWISGDSAEELLNIGIEMVIKTGGKSPLQYYFDKLCDEM